MSEAGKPRPATFEDVKRLVARLNEAGVPYILIGGYALFAHGYHRATEDIDLVVPVGRETGQRLVRALLTLPEEAAKEIDPAWFEEPETIRVAGEFVIDIMFNAAGETWETLSGHAETIEVDGVSIRTLDLNGLLLTKRTTREKDKIDRFALERAIAELEKQRGND